MSSHIVILTVALLPVAVLLFYILRKDSRAPEPSWQLIKAFLYGVLAIPLSLCMSVPMGMAGLYSEEPLTVLGCIGAAFRGAAVPEETAKLFLLWILLRKNRYFDEKMDGIVYAVCVSLGFAAAENVLYLFSNYDNYLTVGISRALFAIPGHFGFGVLMGYYYSMARFYPKFPVRNRTMVIAAPVLAHGIYDSILFMLDDILTPAISGILFVVFLVFCHWMWKYGSRKIEEHLSRDADSAADDMNFHET